jgi:hypothetical protein
MRQSKVRCPCCHTDMPVRVCSECGQPKGLSEFISHRKLNGGLPYAKTCSICRSRHLKWARAKRLEAVNAQ